jgi:hypothetical protein
MNKSGGSKADCSTFADTTIVKITKSVDAQQISLTAVDNGGTCADEGQTIATDNKAIVVAAGASRPDRCDYTHREGNRLLTRATIAFSVDLDTLKPAANALTTRDKLATNKPRANVIRPKLP